ncbi:hypothetical protein [Streptomyces diastatochromogenes]|uniref:hypothetical protein n=1 Tax=Streptomyces diastatochromogenes TaxID=42236 RepID=UPI003684B865
MKRRTGIAVGTTAALAVTALSVVAATYGGSADHDQAKDRAKDQGVILAEGNDRYPSRTAQDWVTYADHAVVVTALDDQAVEPDTSDPDNPEGDSGPIMRKVTLRVDKVLWSKDKPAHAAPSTFAWDAFGWHQTEDGQRVEMSGAHEPRIEPGHTYVMALQWQAPRCPAGDEPIPGEWRGLGGESTIPYDHEVLGQGEFEGETQSGASAEESALPSADPNYALRDELAGEKADALAAKLSQTTPGTPEAAEPAADPCE